MGIIQTQAASPKDVGIEQIWAILQETARIVQNNAQQIGKLGSRFGEMIEYMVLPNLIEKFQELGFIRDIELLKN